MAALIAAGHRVVGPTARDGAIVLDELTGAGDLPAGLADEQAPGRYRLGEVGTREATRRFAFATPAQPWKQYLWPQTEVLVRAHRGANGGVVVDEPRRARDDHRLVLFGVRPCDLASLAILDRVLGREQGYAARRARCLLVAVACTDPAGTCFCVSMGTGPGPRAGGYDLALTELDGDRYVVAVGTDAGAAALAALECQAAGPGDESDADQRVDAAAERMGREMDPDGLPELLARVHEHPRWQIVAERCLSCANCTLVCPTCFCSTVDDVTDLTGADAVRTRRWDSCFTSDFSYLHGGVVRASVRSRYRQWLTHKLGTWTEQFGTSGCVGCGRCIAWCPVAIDITEEAAAIRASDGESNANDR